MGPLKAFYYNHIIIWFFPNGVGINGDQNRTADGSD